MITVLVLMGALHAGAADGGNLPIRTAKPTPKLVKIGDDTFIDLQDGRMAGFVQMIGQPVRTFVGMRQTENTCDYAQILSNCRLEMDIASRDINVVWVKHPDASKLNQTVKVYTLDGTGKRQNEFSLEEKNGILFWYETLKDPTYRKKMSNDRLICDSLAWAQNIPLVNAHLKIDSWATELMLGNPETGVNENQSISQVYDVNLKKIDEVTLEFESFGPSRNLISIPPYIATQTASLTFMDNTNKQCQVSFQSSLDQIIKVTSDPAFTIKDKATLSPLRNASALKQTSIQSILGFAFDSRMQWEFE